MREEDEPNRLFAELPFWRYAVRQMILVFGFSYLGLAYGWDGFVVAFCTALACWLSLGLYCNWWVGLSHNKDTLHIALERRLRETATDQQTTFASVEPELPQPGQASGRFR